MNDPRPIAYEPHPVTPERKAELRAQGFTIIDAVFKPVDHDKSDPEGAKKPSDGLKVEELKEALTAKGISIPEGAKKPELAALLDATPASPANPVE